MAAAAAKALLDQRAELHRVTHGLPALSKAEAERRGLRIYQGTPCARGHSGARLTRNGECAVCKSKGKPVSQAYEAVGLPTLSPDIIDLAERYHIPLSKIIDADGIDDYKGLIISNDAVLAFNVPPCAKAGHSLRDKYGNCALCNQKQLAFAERATKQGYLYAAHSKTLNLVKIGFASNLEKRHKSLKAQKYAGADDWTIFFHELRADGGRAEIAVHKLLSQYTVGNLSYEWSGETRLAKEVYSCSPDQALQSLSQV